MYINMPMDSFSSTQHSIPSFHSLRHIFHFHFNLECQMYWSIDALRQSYYVINQFIINLFCNFMVTVPFHLILCCMRRFYISCNLFHFSAHMLSFLSCKSWRKPFHCRCTKNFCYPRNVIWFVCVELYCVSGTWWSYYEQNKDIPLDTSWFSFHHFSHVAPRKISTINRCVIQGMNVSHFPDPLPYSSLKHGIINHILWHISHK